jgi:DNA mismatch repair protein MutS2
MDSKVYRTLELDKILDRLAGYASFSASAALLRAITPTNDLDEAHRRQQETSQARTLLEFKPDASTGGARDVRPHARSAERGIMLMPEQLLEVKTTLQAGTALKRAISHLAEHCPLLAEIAAGIDEARYVVAEITRTLSDHGEVLDSASERLAQIRADLRLARDRLHTRLQAIIASPEVAPHLQEAIVTQRSGRYVIPIKAEHKGYVKGLVHDQSSSGATLFIEPLATVEVNNRIRELELAEEDEIRRILSALSALVGQEAEGVVQTVEALAALDVALAKARYADAIGAHSPTLVPFEQAGTLHPGSTLRLYNARHPLLDPHSVVPIDVELDDENYALVITGPNTGGKTVSLKTVGLLALMAQSGLHIPAAPESTLSIFGGVYADIGDEQSIEQSLSTFSSHMTNIIRVLGQADSRSLVILDELGAGTDPVEGSALARAILSHLLQIGATTLVATHYPELKVYAHSTPGVRNASVEFDLETLSPTYHLTLGLPGRSNALAIATRLGLPGEIVEGARTYLGEAEMHAEDLLDEIHRTREEIRHTQTRQEEAHAEAEALRDELRARLSEIEQERQAIIAEARQEAGTELDMLREEAEALRRRLRRARESLEASRQIAEVAEIEEQVEALEEIIEQPVEPRVEMPEPEGMEPPRALAPGDHVYLPSLHAEGEIVALTSTQAEVQVGNLRVRTDLDGLQWRPGEPTAHEAEVMRAPRVESPGMELHLRGMTVDEALDALDRYLDDAYLAGLPWARIVHGKGSGVLRAAIREALAHHPLVRDYQRAELNEGGDGVTVVRLQPMS